MTGKMKAAMSGVWSKLAFIRHVKTALEARTVVTDEITQRGDWLYRSLWLSG